MSVQQKTGIAPGKETIYIGMIENFSQNVNSFSISIDTVEYYTGENARLAYISDCRMNGTDSTDTPAEYYIRNPGTESLEFSLPDDARITMQTFSHDSTGSYNFNQSVSAGKFKAFIKSQKTDDLKLKLFAFKILKNQIISIREIYIP